MDVCYCETFLPSRRIGAPRPIARPAPLIDGSPFQCARTPCSRQRMSGGHGAPITSYRSCRKPAVRQLTVLRMNRMRTRQGPAGGAKRSSRVFLSSGDGLDVGFPRMRCKQWGDNCSSFWRQGETSLPLSARGSEHLRTSACPLRPAQRWASKNRSMRVAR